MKKLFSILILLSAVFCANAQDAKATLDKAAKQFTKSTVQANFKMSGALGNESGYIAIKGKKFCAKGSKTTVWFDGKTQWTYVKSTDEVNVSTPNAKKLNAMNPYNFVNLYKNGYTLSEKSVSNGKEVYMKANSTSQSFQEVYLTLNSKSQPVKIKFKNKKGWTTIDITNYQTKKLNDKAFQFNKKDYPTVEVIDLR